MERWLKAPEAAVPDPAKETARRAAVKTEMLARWDATNTREEMLAHVERWLAYGAAAAGVKGCVTREALYPIMVEIYQEKHPEDFDAKPGPIGDVGKVEP